MYFFYRWRDIDFLWMIVKWCKIQIKVFCRQLFKKNQKNNEKWCNPYISQKSDFEWHRFLVSIKKTIKFTSFICKIFRTKFFFLVKFFKNFIGSNTFFLIITTRTAVSNFQNNWVIVIFLERRYFLLQEKMKNYWKYSSRSGFNCKLFYQPHWFFFQIEILQNPTKEKTFCLNFFSSR